MEDTPISESSTPRRRITLWDSSWPTQFIFLVLASAAFFRVWSTAWLQFTPAAMNWSIGLLAPIVLFLVLPLAMRKPRFARPQWPSLKSVFVELLIAIPTTVLTVWAVTAYIQIVQRFAPGSLMGTDTMESMMRSPAGWSLYSFLFLMVFIGPVCEEVFFRGFLYNVFRHRMHVVAALALQSVLFGASHNYPAAGVGAVSLIGLVAGIVYQWRKTILAPVLLHTCFNGLLAMQVLVAVQTNANLAVVGIGPNLAADGCVVASVAENSPAAESGLEPGDIILQFGEYSTLNHEHLYSAVRLYEPGDLVPVVYEREGETWEVDVELISRREMTDRQAHVE